jgi:2-keto-3-deoxy-L-rhamnonate aldolase RhmA
VHPKVTLAIAVTTVIAGFAVPKPERRLNPVVEVLAQNKPVFGVYAPRNGRGGRGAPAADAPPPKSAAELAKEAVAYPNADFIFDGSMEGEFDRAFPNFTEFMKGLSAAGMVEKSPSLRLHHAMFVKTHKIGEDPAAARVRIGRQLNEGVSGVTFVEAESADEVKAGLAAMRFKSQGGTRDDNVGNAPAYWGMSEADYKKKADLWPLNPNGELVNFTIVESKEGLKHLREIAAVKGIGVLFPGAGTLRGVFTDTTGGQRKFDAEAWEGAIQQVLAACKEFKVPCGYPATANDIETRMKQGFSVFIINWGDQGFKAVDIGRQAGGRVEGDNR